MRWLPRDRGTKKRLYEHIPLVHKIPKCCGEFMRAHSTRDYGDLVYVRRTCAKCKKVKTVYESSLVIRARRWKGWNKKSRA